MSYQNGYQEIGGAAPAGSVAPLNSTQDGSKWHHGVTASGIAKLTRLSTEINECFDKGLRSHVKMQIDIGRLLNEARVEIPGDRQFGQWREANTPINNKSTANKLMNLAKQVGDGRITQDMIAKLPLSNLKELLTAPDSVLGAVEARLEAGENVTRDEIRELSRAENAPGAADDAGDEAEGDARSLTPDPAPAASPEASSSANPKPAASPEASSSANPKPAAAPVKGPTSPAQPPRKTPASQIPMILAMTLSDRLRHLDPDKTPYDGCKVEEWAWLCLGLDPNPAYFPSLQIVEVIGAEWNRLILGERAHDQDRLIYTLQKAEKICHELIESDTNM